MKKSMSAEMPVVTEEELESYRKDLENVGPESVVSLIPPNMRAKQIEAWNAMSENLVKVVKTIKNNEERQAAAELRVARRGKRLAGAVYLALVLGVIFIGSVALVIRAQVDEGKAAVVDMRQQLTVTSQTLAKMKTQQDATLTAVNALAVALGRKIEADTSQDPAADVEAAEAAQKAQVKALEAKKTTANTPSEKAAADREIEQVKKRPPPSRRRRKNDPFE
jgi:hypothetical protein